MTSIQTGPAFAKTIILGDHGCGRTSLIENLDIYKTAKALHQNPLYSHQHPLEDHRQYSLTDTSSFFTAIELTSHELDSTGGISSGGHIGTGNNPGASGASSSGNNSHSHHNHSQSAVLKLWEYTQNLSKKDEQLAFRGALFCVIVFDICNIHSFRAVFERWIPLKEQLSSDSFLYVVGTHLDMTNYRQVSLDEICKACAKKDAIYVEVSNTTGTNIPLLRKLLCRRVEFMLKQKEAFANRTNLTSSILQGPSGSVMPNGEDDRDRYTSEESKYNRSRGLSGLGLEVPGNQSEISIPSLEPHIMASSIGSILTSVFGLEEWQGYHKQEQELVKISERIDSFVSQLAQSADHLDVDIGNLPITDDIFKTDVQDKPLESLLDSNETSSSEQDTANNLQDLANAFKILGLNVPKSLIPKGSASSASGAAVPPVPEGSQPEPNNSGNNNKNPPASPARGSLRKMLVKLPNGSSTEMIIDLDFPLEQQIDAFVTSHGIGVESESRRKLLLITSKLQKDHIEAANNRQRPSSANRSVTSNSVSTTNAAVQAPR
jgi:hypothetical protein